ncbi:MAG: hypothetical protein JWP67_1977 [Mucilaginibacter sp.]|jgi:hypothetical protein|nr:hypothetical protein [Mucilaginibacter sp.]
MKKLRFNFNHPVIGHVCLVPLTCLKGIYQRFKVTSADDHTLEIPVTNCHEGKWKLILDWEHDGKNFSFNEEFEITAAKS